MIVYNYIYCNEVLKYDKEDSLIVFCFRLLMNRYVLMFLGLFGLLLVWNKRDFF